MTLLVTSLAPTNFDDLREGAGRAWADGAEAVEIRLDTFTEDLAGVAALVSKHSDRTWIITCRSKEEGGHSRASAADRLTRVAAVADKTDAYIDFEYADWKRDPKLQRRLAGVLSEGRGSGCRLILSAHDFGGSPADISTLASEMIAVREAAVAKIAYAAHHIADSFPALDLMHEVSGASDTSRQAKRPVLTAVAMGEDALWTRVLAKKLGAFATYCALDPDATTAPGQITLDEMIRQYRWRDLNESTQVFGVMGNPVAHSMGPPLFNRWFADAGINAVYLPLRVRGDENAVHDFLDCVKRRSWLDVGGLSVTIPHKVSALRWVGDGVDAMARGIGALNTIHFVHGDVKGYNTDAYAAVSSLCDALECDRNELAGMRVDLLGAGGAAKALGYALSEVGTKTTIYGRTQKEVRRLAEELGAEAATWDERKARHGEVLINCTSVGMWPSVGASPMPADSLSECRLVFDLIYNPLETRLLRDAREAGTNALGGLDMFVRQAATQFELWTGQQPDTNLGCDLIGREIERRMGKPA